MGRDRWEHCRGRESGFPLTCLPTPRRPGSFLWLHPTPRQVGCSLLEKVPALPLHTRPGTQANQTPPLAWGGPVVHPFSSLG